MEEFTAKYYDSESGKMTEIADVYYAHNEPKRQQAICVNVPGGQVVISTKKMVSMLRAYGVI